MVHHLPMPQKEKGIQKCTLQLKIRTPISMVIEDQNFMEYTITSGFYSGGPWVYFVEHGKYKVVSIDKGYRVSCNGSTVQVGSVITFSGATGHIGFYVNN